MAADEERLQILRMVQGGQISTDEAAELLDALEEPMPASGPHGRPDPSSAPAQDTNSGQATVRANVLVKALEWGARLARKANIDVRWRARDIN
jgi:hypothetical protein